MLFKCHCMELPGAFGPFASFGAPTPLLASPHSHRLPHHSTNPVPHHHQHSPAPAAFFPPPFLYWSYPSPPVSPTAYYGQPTPHSNAQMAGNITATQHQAMYSLDFLPALQPSALSPSVPIPSPNTYMPPKQFSALPAHISTGVTLGLGGSNVGNRAGVGSLSPYHKFALPLSMPPQHQANNIYHHYNTPPTISGSPQPVLLPLPPTTGSVSSMPLTRPITAASAGISVSTTALLTVDTYQNER